jgi:hypothetical protein
MTVPSNLIPTRITQLPLAQNPTPQDTVILVQGGVTKQASLASTTAATAVPVTRRIDTGGGLVGGGDLSANRTISLAPYFSAGIWGGPSSIPVISVDQYGRVDAASQVPLTFANVGSKPTTLAGYGITDGVNTDRRVDTTGSLVGGGRLNANRTLSLQGDQITPGASKYYGTDGTGAKGFFDITAGGTVQFVALTMPGDLFSVVGSPITTSGTFAVTLAPQFPNQILAGPASGAVGAAPSFRALVAADLPVVPIAKGGTGATDAPTAVSNLGAVPATRQVGTGTGLTGGGNLSADRTIALANTAVTPGGYGSASQVGTFTVDAQGRLTAAANVAVTIDAAAVASGTLPVARGGTGVSTLTGYAKGNGSSAFTGVTAIPNADLQNSSVTIGGTAIALGGTASTISGLTTLTLTQNPLNPLDAATKQYVDAAVEGLNVHAPAAAATTANLTATYNNGVSGVGATLTNAGAQTAFAVDGYTALLNDRILVKNQSADAQNGVYTVTTLGSGSTNWVLTRAVDMNNVGTGADQLGPGDYIFVSSGTQNGGTAWVVTTPLPITIGTTPITFVQFAGPGTYTAGAGLTLTGTQFSITSTGVTPASYGTASSVPTIAVDARGQITTAVNTPIAIAASAVTSGSLAVARGGTGLSASPANGQLAIGNGTGYALATLTAGSGISITNGAGSISIATTGGGGTVTSVGASGGTTGMTFSGGPITGSGTLTLGGTLAVANGGTNGTAVPSAGAVAYGTGTAYAFSAAGSSNQVLLSGGTGAPTWANQSSLSVGSATTATTATNLAGGIASQIPYQTGAGATAFIANGTSGQVLRSNGTSAPSWAGIDGGTF